MSGSTHRHVLVGARPLTTPTIHQKMAVTVDPLRDRLLQPPESGGHGTRGTAGSAPLFRTMDRCLESSSSWEPSLPILSPVVGIDSGMPPDHLMDYLGSRSDIASWFLSSDSRARESRDHASTSGHVLPVVLPRPGREGRSVRPLGSRLLEIPQPRPHSNSTAPVPTARHARAARLTRRDSQRSTREPMS